MKKLLLVLLGVSFLSSASQQGVLLKPFRAVTVTTAQLMAGHYATVDFTPVKKNKLKASSVTIEKHFLVADYSETGTYGPSAEASVGSEQIMVGSKGRVRTLNKKTGQADGVLNLSHDRFFSSVMRGAYTADPNVIFDVTSGRWFLFCNNNPYGCLLAMSSGDPITPDTEWSFFIVDKNSDPAFENKQPNTDYTTLGVDARAVYCAQNVFDFADPFFVSSAAYVIPKDSLIKGVARVFAFRNLVDQKTMEGPITLWAPTNFDKNPKHGFFASIPAREFSIGQASRILINKVSFTKEGPILSSPFSVAVDSYVDPIAVQPLGTPKSHPVNPVAGAVMCPLHLHNGKLFIVHNIGVDNKGISSFNTTLTRNAIRYYEIDVSRKTPKLLKQTTLFTPSHANDFGQRSYLDPSIMVNKDGKILVGFSVCSAQERLNAGVAAIKNGTFLTPVLYTKSTSNYYATSDWEFDPDARWGDHTRTAIDPCDDTTFWTTQQWCSDKNTWGLEIAQVKVK